MAAALPSVERGQSKANVASSAAHAPNMQRAGQSAESVSPGKPPPPVKQKTLGMSQMRHKRQAAKEAKRTSASQIDPLVAREDILASLYALLAKSEQAPKPADAGALETGDELGAMAAHPPSSAKPLNGRNPTMSIVRPGSSGKDHGRSGATSPLTTPLTPHPPQASRASSARNRPNSSRDFLLTVLQPRDNSNAESALPEAGIPTWKEELVERVRRRTSSAKAAARAASARTRPPHAGAPGTGSPRGAPPLMNLDDTMPGGSPTSPTNGLGDTYGTLSVTDEDALEMLGSEAAAKAAKFEQNLRKRHATLSFFRDSISDLLLTSQFQEADYTQRLAQLEKLQSQQAASGGAGGRLAKHREGSDAAMTEIERKLCSQLELFESRAAQAQGVNTGLETIINELRRERASQLSLVKTRADREHSMSVDMRSFAASAHGALDEKERIKSRVRRMRHEWKVERSTQETELATLERNQGDLEKQIETSQAEEMAAQQDLTRRHYREMREISKLRDYRERRLGYLRAQSLSLTNEFRKLGEVAGVSGAGAQQQRGGDRFDHEDPSTSGVLTSTLRNNDIRNESEHAYAQSLDAEIEEMQGEVSALIKEEEELLDMEATHQAAAADAEKAASKEAAAAVEHAARFDELNGRLSNLRPLLSETVSRLEEGYASLDAAAVDGEYKPLEPLPARGVPDGLQPLSIDEMPLYTGTEVELERLDALLQQMASRVTRVVLGRTASKRRDRDSYEEARMSPPPINPALRMFTELPESAGYAEMRTYRTELETVVARNKEVEDMEG